MAIDMTRARACANRLLMSRLRILGNHGFYGLLLSHITFALDESLDTAATDAKKIYFSPDFLDKLSDSELDFIMMHEIMHVVLQHCFRDGDRNPDAFNIACDIVVNSNILKSLGGNLSSITVRCAGGESMHLAPDGKEGHLYTAEEVYEMLPDSIKNQRPKGGLGEGDGDSQDNSSGNPQSRGSASTSGKLEPLDDHSRWGTGEIDNETVDLWAGHLEDAIKVITITEPSNTWGNIPAFAQRMLRERSEGQTNWREVLSNFVQEEINDYSFSPPDRRFGEFDFFLPDYNETDESVKDILFMIDTSGSMTDQMITDAFNEVRGAILQFNGRLEAHLGFFDATVVEPVTPFSSIDELDIIRPIGGGGTNFHCIFHYVRSKMDTLPSSIIILTDGYAPFPQKQDAMDIPVLWVINNEEVDPPWGKVIRIKDTSK